MALSLPGERSMAAATPSNPLRLVLAWLLQLNAARKRRLALEGLLELDHARLHDLGITRDDIRAALAQKGHRGAYVLHSARARRAEG